VAAISRHVHPQTSFDWVDADKAAPDLGLRFTDAHDEQYEPKCLVFTDPDGERHVYPFTDQARVALVKQLTGGVILPGMLNGSGSLGG